VSCSSEGAVEIARLMDLDVAGALPQVVTECLAKEVVVVG
jgi:hypothetical protein